jgi:hypothetical protein
MITTYKFGTNILGKALENLAFFLIECIDVKYLKYPQHA